MKKITNSFDDSLGKKNMREGEGEKGREKGRKKGEKRREKERERERERERKGEGVMETFDLNS